MRFRAAFDLQREALETVASVDALVLAGHSRPRTESCFDGTKHIGQGKWLFGPRIAVRRALVYLLEVQL